MPNNNLDPKRAAELRRKYGMDEPPQKNNPVVSAIMRTNEMYDRLFARDSGELFDPVRNPQMYAVAQQALRALHLAMAKPVERPLADGLGHVVFGVENAEIAPVHFDHHDDPSDVFTPSNPDDPALYVHFVGSSVAFVVRGPKPVSAFDLATRGAGEPRRELTHYSDMFRLMMEVRAPSKIWPRECNVKVSRGCDGDTQLIPYRAGAFLLLFEACEPCMKYAGAGADTGYELSVMEAYARRGLPFP